jgi:hypothetical protein
MFTGGNVGMVLGMLAGGWCAAQFTTGDMVLAVATSFAGMTLGMCAGMLAGTWFAERLLVGLTALWSRQRVLLDEVVSGQAEADRDHRVADVTGR